MKSVAFACSGSFAQWLSLTATLLSILSGCYGTPTHGGKGGGGGDGTSGTGGVAVGTGGSAGSAGTEARGGAGGTVGAGGAGGSAAAGAAGAGAGGSGGAGGTTGTGGASGTSGAGGAGGTGSCAAPNTQCPNACTNLATDANNCTACGHACLPPPANGHAICQAAAGCAIECDSGHLKCGSTCCDTPPANAFATCSSSSTCGAQCNSGNHACNGTSSPCYDDTDVTHCGASCTDCRQPNATPVCTGTQCANICTGTTLSCPGTAGHVVCGTWDFESGTTEGWTNMGDIGVDVSGGQLQASSIRAALGSYALAVGHNDTAAISASGGGFSTFAVHLCPTGVPISLNGKSFDFSMYLAPTTGGDLNPQFNLEFYMVLRNGQNLIGDVYLDGGYTGMIMPFPANQWFNVSSGPLTNAAVTDIEIAFRTYNDPWVGTVFFDHIRIE